MLISAEMEQAINDQIGREFGASLQYTNMATYFDGENLRMLAKLFHKQSDEERQHALKLVNYLVEAGCHVRIPAPEAPQHEFTSAIAAVQLALDWELRVTEQFNSLMDLALAKKDHLSQAFLSWFVTEQLEEVSSMTRLLDLVRRAGDNVLLAEAYLVHGS
jgi:bacterioferritin B